MMMMMIITTILTHICNSEPRASRGLEANAADNDDGHQGVAGPARRVDKYSGGTCRAQRWDLNSHISKTSN